MRVSPYEIKLKAKEAFERNPLAYDDSLTRENRDPIGVIHAYLGAFCAGMNGRIADHVRASGVLRVDLVR